jgi:hypothetical protein
MLLVRRRFTWRQPRGVEVIKLLMQLGAQIDAQTADGETPLKLSIRLGAGFAGAGTHRTRTKGGGTSGGGSGGGGGDQRACTAGS